MLKLRINFQGYLEINFHDYLERTADHQTPPHPAYTHELSELLPITDPREQNSSIMDSAPIQNWPGFTFSYPFYLWLM